jgi:hypothetical protein
MGKLVMLTWRRNTRNKQSHTCLSSTGADSRLLTKAASGVLASLRGSTYRTEYDSLAAALLDDLSEQLAGYPDSVAHRRHRSFWEAAKGFSTH